jgi:hypothetical protein
MSKSIFNNQKSNSGKGGCCSCCGSKSILNKLDCTDNNKFTTNSHPTINNNTNNKLPQIINTNQTKKNSP